MPKVSEAHREARRAQILKAATACVAREGFHRTTMANVIEEAGLSAGAVYGYFPSKTALIRAIADDALGLAATRLEVLAERPGPMTLAQVVQEYVTSALETFGQDAPRIAVQVWAEAARDPQIAAVASERVRAVRSALAVLVRRCQAEGTLGPGPDPDRTAQVLVGLLPGYIFQRLLIDDLTPESYLLSVLELIAPAG